MNKDVAGGRRCMQEAIQKESNTSKLGVLSTQLKHLLPSADFTLNPKAISASEARTAVTHCYWETYLGKGSHPEGGLQVPICRAGNSWSSLLGEEKWDKVSKVKEIWMGLFSEHLEKKQTNNSTTAGHRTTTLDSVIWRLKRICGKE